MFYCYFYCWFWKCFFLNWLVFCISFHVVNVLIVSKSHVNVIIFVAFILCIFFVSCFFLIYVISFIFLFNLRFKNVCSTFISIIFDIIVDKLYVIFIYMFAFYMRSLSLSIFFNLSIVLFYFFNIKIMSICLFFAKKMLSRRIIFSIKVHYLLNIIIKILNAFFFFNL